MIEDGNVCIPVNWKKDAAPEFLFFSRDGGRIPLHLPREEAASAVRGRLARLSVEGAEDRGTTEIADGVFTVELEPGEAGKLVLD